MSKDTLTYGELSVGDCIVNHEVKMFIIGKSSCKFARFNETRFDFIVFVVYNDTGVIVQNSWNGLMDTAYCILQDEVHCPGPDHE